MNLKKMLHKWSLIGQVSIVATVLIIILGLLAVSLFYFFSLRKESNKESEAQVQTAQYLKLLTSHSHPEAGEEWVVSFETEGEADLTIAPEDQDSIGDLDFVFLSCDGKEKAEEEAPQILTGDVIFYPNWQCAGRGEIVHLVNIAGKHTLRFRFGNKAAFAYNNPDSVTDSFDDESKIAATSSVVITGGHAQLATCGDIGDSCPNGNGDCCNNRCVDGYCCDDVCGGNCDRCNDGGLLGTCTDVNSDCAGTGASCYCSSGNCQACSNTGSSCYCSGYACQACSNNDSSCTCSGYVCQACAVCKSCSSYNCINRSIDVQPSGCTGCQYCDGSGQCLTCYWSYNFTASACKPDPASPALGCYPSRTGSPYQYSATEDPSCTSLLYTDDLYWVGSSCYRYYCKCY